MAETAVARRGISIALACRTFGLSETCYRYSPRLSDENEQIADLLIGLTQARKTWGFGLCFLYLRNIQGHDWNHKRVYRIYRALELNLRIKPRKPAQTRQARRTGGTRRPQPGLVDGFHGGSSGGWQGFPASQRAG
ncbi:hypothetical protein PHAMO_70001 [Magnetospirillum molischianum DSM 120]|uniref:Transposase n=1 Tax=Magnetospirillum molischianum DSM 120 TaxID=1150626 RepID=H8FXV9_MAGML|nr:hypothetical protein PHAMO_70001 [Magnetospirillum molischianum DSM 120]